MPKPLAIIPTYLRSALHFDVLETCLESMRRTAPADVLDVLIVDDGSPAPEWVDALTKLKDTYQYDLHLKVHNTGFAKTVNVGLKRCLDEGRDAILVNSDIEFVNDRWLPLMLNQPTREGDGLASVVGARLVYPNGLLQHCGIFFSLLQRHFDHLYKYGPHDLPEANQARVAPVTGALQFIRHECLTAVGLYDEQFKLGWEDVDYGIRVWQSGRQSVYQPEVLAIHHESLIRGSSDDPKIGEWTAKSWRYFCEKHAETSFAEFVPTERAVSQSSAAELNIDPNEVLFVGLGTSAVNWYRCILPALAMGADWYGGFGVPPENRYVTALVQGQTRLPSDEDWDRYKVVILQQPHGEDWREFIRKLQAEGKRVLYEVDDYLHAIHEKEDHDWRKSFDDTYLVKAEMCMRAADGLICSTEFIASQYRAFNEHVYVCKNGLDVDRYRLTRPPRPSVNIGWAGATAHQQALTPWLQVVAQVMRERDHVMFVSIGQPWADAFNEQFPNRSVATPFASLETYPAAMTMIDIALAPGWEGRGSRFYRGKSDLRFLEAGALGIPIIADPKIYDDIEHGVSGFHCTDPAELFLILRGLVDDKELRTTVGSNARDHVHAHRSMGTAVKQWFRAVNAALETPAKAGVFRPT